MSKKFGQKEIFVDDEDYLLLSKTKWHLHRGRNTLYAIREEGRLSDERKIIYMHRQILGIKDSNVIIDHKDQNGLNNQKSNLRRCSHSQNLINRPGKNTTSKYKGVYFDTKLSKYVAQISFNKKTKSLGCFLTEEEAAIRYDKFAIILHGEYAHLNILPKGTCPDFSLLNEPKNPNINCKKVVMKSMLGYTIKIFASFSEAQRETGISFKGIHKACNRNNNVFKGYRWSYF